MITSLSQLDLNKSYTYADYLLWQFEERVELIKGKYYGTQPFVEGDSLTTPVLPGINILLSDVFVD